MQSSSPLLKAHASPILRKTRVSVSCPSVPSIRRRRRLSTTKCSPRAQGEEGNPILRSSVAAVTAILNTFSSRKEDSDVEALLAPASMAEVVNRLKADYVQNQYFVTGKVDLGLYEENCLFADPTISFRGREKYTRNLQTLKAFFIDPTIQLFSLEELASEPLSLKARWRLRVQLRLPWRPLIDIEGSTLYTLDKSRYQVVEHREQWSESAWEAVLQIFNIKKLSSTAPTS